jgi:hypothetical protein
MNEWVRSIGGMILTGETEVQGEKHYTASVVDEWMNEWMNEWVWSNGGMILRGEAGVLGEKHYTASLVVEWMSMERWWYDTDRLNRSTWI